MTPCFDEISKSNPLNSTSDAVMSEGERKGGQTIKINFDCDQLRLKKPYKVKKSESKRKLKPSKSPISRAPLEPI